MPRSMWRGALSFGLVAIPVRLYLATEAKGISFRLLCPTCRTPIKNRRWCPNENVEVGWNDALRGFEVSKDEYVVIEERELDQLPVASTHAVDIVEFCADAEIDAGVYIKGAYYLEPEAVGVKPYVLLREALARSGKVAIGKITLRDREHLCRVAIHDDGLLLNVLHWPDEIRDAGELSIPHGDDLVHERELEMATMLIDNLSARFDPARYHDEFRDAVLELVEAKVNHEAVTTAAPPHPAPVTDLMAALKASVEATQPTATASVGAAPDTPGEAMRGAPRGSTATAAKRRKAS